MTASAHGDFRQAVIKGEALIPIIWKECAPRLLVVTDGLNYSSANGFGLTRFVDTLAASTIHGMMPIVVRASRGADPTADISNFDFTNPTNGLIKARYDVVFLFGISSEGQNQRPAAQVNAIAKFMQDGGGVFATGDHESLGASLSRDVPRIRHMRFWKQSETPNVGDVTRLSTNLRGDNLDYEFVDQSDVHPQRLYVNYRTVAGGTGEAHPLLQGGKLGAIEVFPDHPHEGDGHNPNVGRAVTEATWHHFVNINIDGTGLGRSGLQDPPGTDPSDLERIRQYYRNLGTWLMPKKVRKCLRFPLIVAEAARFPLFEELRVPPLDSATGEELHRIGTQVAAALAVRRPAWQAAELVAVALEDGAGLAQLTKLIELGAQFGKASPRDLGLAALGGITVGTLTRLAEVESLEDIDPHKAFDDMVEPVARMAIRRYTAACRRELGALDAARSELG